MKQTLFYIGTAALLMSCSQHDELPTTPVTKTEVVTLTMSLNGFSGDATSRTNEEGTSWEEGDKFRMKIICPHTPDHQNGENYNSGYHEVTFGKDAVQVTQVSTYEAQATTYIYSAQNTTGTRRFVVDDYRYSRPSNFFSANQSKLADFKASDVVWAQGIRQTGAQEVHLNFEHKVAKLKITIDDSSFTHKVPVIKPNEKDQTKKDTTWVDDAWPLSDTLSLTLEGMPDIDGAELIVGDYYGSETYEDYNYNYRQKTACNYELNGMVIGIEVIDEANKRSKVATLSGRPKIVNSNDESQSFGVVPNTGVYTPYKAKADAKEYWLYVPPCTLADSAIFWVRDGERRYSDTLSILNFEEGKCYPITLKF